MCDPAKWPTMGGGWGEWSRTWVSGFERWLGVARWVGRAKESHWSQKRSQRERGKVGGNVSDKTGPQRALTRFGAGQRANESSETGVLQT